MSARTPGPLVVDGRGPLTADLVAAVTAACAEAEDRQHGVLAVEVSGAPERGAYAVADVALVTKWERALHRLERLPVATVALARGDCGGPALDVLLATDVRYATPDLRLLVAVSGDATWPGMAVHRLGQQAGAAARPAVLFGAPLTAADAHALRLVDAVAADPALLLADLVTGTGALAGLSGSELAVRRRLLLDATTTGHEEALGAHLAACDRMARRAAASAS